jgi:hypothetical protein
LHRSRCPQLNFPTTYLCLLCLPAALFSFLPQKRKQGGRVTCYQFHLQYPDPSELADGSRPKRSLWDSRNDLHHIQENPTSFDNDCYFHLPRCPRLMLGTSVPPATPPWRSHMPLHMPLPWPLLPTHLWPPHAPVFNLLKTIPGHVVLGLDYSGIAKNSCLLV